MPFEYPDFEDRPPPFNENVAFEQGVDDSGGYAVPIPADYTLRGYQSTMVRLDGHGTAVQVEVGWTHSGDGASLVTIETKTQESSAAGALFFVNQGDVLDHVTLTGGGNTDYAVVESNQLPLARSDTVEFAEYYNLGGEPGLIDPVSFTATDVYNAPDYQFCELFSMKTSDPSAFALDAANHWALIKRQGLYLVTAQLLQADRPHTPFDTGVPISGIMGIGVDDSLGGGQDPAESGLSNFPMAQGFLDGQMRDLTYMKVINAFDYVELDPFASFLPLMVKLYYAPAVNTDVIHGNWSMMIWRMRDGDITFLT